MLDQSPTNPHTAPESRKIRRQSPFSRLYSGLRSSLMVALLSSCQSPVDPTDCKPSEGERKTLIQRRSGGPAHPRGFLHLSQDISKDPSMPNPLRERMLSRLAFHQRKRSEMFTALMEHTLSLLHPEASHDDAEKWFLLYKDRRYWTLRSAWSLLYEGHCNDQPTHPDQLSDFPALNGRMSAVQRLGVLDRRFDIALAQYALAQISARRNISREDHYAAIEAAWKSLLESDELLYQQALRDLFQQGDMPLRRPRKAPPLEKEH